MPSIVPAIILSRRPRRLAGERPPARSRLGGAPCLGSAPWPCDESGTPLHFMAEIDLAEVAAAVAQSKPAADLPHGLPRAGALAFFIGAGGEEAIGKVVYIPPDASAGETPAPGPLPSVEAIGGDALLLGDGAGPWSFPRWPVDLTAFEAPAAGDHDAREQAQAEAIERCFGVRDDIRPEAFVERKPIPNWWRNAIHYSLHVVARRAEAPAMIGLERQMLADAQGKLAAAPAFGARAAAAVRGAQESVDLHRRNLDEMERALPLLDASTAEVSAWVEGRDPWRIMSAEEWARLEELWSRWREFSCFMHIRGEFGVDRLRRDMIDALPLEGTAEYDALPEEVRAFVHDRRAPGPQWWRSAIALARRLREIDAKRVPEVLARATAARDAARDAQEQRAGGAEPGGTPSDGAAKLAKAEADLAAQIALARAFSGFVAECDAFVAHRDPWSQMSAEEGARLAAVLAESSRNRFATFTRFRIPASLGRLEAATLRLFAAADEATYSRLPERLGHFVDERCRLPLGPCHQMFGVPAAVQYNALEEHEGDHLLLQLAYDGMMFWPFGDNGVYQFWIEPEALARGEWDRVELTFECH